MDDYGRNFKSPPKQDRGVTVILVDPATDASTGNNKLTFPIPDELNGCNLIRTAATCTSAGTSGSLSVTITNSGSAGTATVAMLATNISIAAGQTTPPKTGQSWRM